MQTLFFVFVANASNLMTTISIRRSYRKQFILSNCLRYPYCEYPDTEKSWKKNRWLCCSHRTCSAVHFPARTVRHLCLENRLLMRRDLQNSKIWEQNFLMETVCSGQRQQLLKITNERKQHKMHNIEGCACRHGEDCSFRTYGYGCTRTHRHTRTSTHHTKTQSKNQNARQLPHSSIPSLPHPPTHKWWKGFLVFEISWSVNKQPHCENTWAFIPADLRSPQNEERCCLSPEIYACF